MTFNKNVSTRHLYRFEREYFWGEILQPIEYLRTLAKKIWTEEGRAGKYLFDTVEPMPSIVAGKGTRYNGRYYSYYDGERIELARSERKVSVLIHEMVHALGYDKHDQAFVEKYFQLLEDFGRCDREYLLAAGAMYGIVTED